MLDITYQVNLLAERIHELRPTLPRLLLAIAGAPGSGKSTLATELARRLRLQKCPAEVVSLDGYHLDNRVLIDRGLSLRKGAPETFDAAGFIHMVRRLRARSEDEVAVPVFDRARDFAVAGALVVPQACPVVIIEGNYLLFDEAPWRDLAPLWDLSARIEVPMPELRARLIQRWLTLGLSRAAATRRAEANDVINAARVDERALPADFLL